MAKVLAAAAAGAWVLYAVAINVFLSTSLFSKVIEPERDTIFIEYVRGWSVWPGRIHAKKLLIRGRDSNVEWDLHIDEVAFDVSFVGLARRRFEASNVDGTGISFRLRQRLEHPPQTDEELRDVADLPPIAGLGPYAVRPPKGDDREVWDDTVYKLWTVRLADVTAKDVREVWIDQSRFVGTTTILGGFYLKPIREVEIGPIRVADARGAILRGGVPTATDVVGEAELAIARFDPRTTPGREVIGKLDGLLDAHARVPDLARAPQVVKNTRFSGPAEIDRVLVRIRQGHVVSDSRIDARAPHTVVTKGDHVLRAALGLHANVARDAGGDQATVHAAMTDATLVRENGEETTTIVTAPRLEVSGEARDLELASPFGDLHAVVALHHGEMPDLAVLGRYVPKDTPVRFERGRAATRIHAEAWMAESRVAADVHLEAANAGLEVDGVAIAGDATIDASTAGFNWDSRVLEKTGLAVNVAKAKLGARPDAKGPRAPVARAEHVRLDVTSARIELDDPVKELAGSFAVVHGEVIEREPDNPFRIGDVPLVIRRGHGQFEANGNVTIKGGVFEAHAVLEAASLEARYGKVDLGAGARATVDAVVKENVVRGRAELRMKRAFVVTDRGRLEGEASVDASVKSWDTKKKVWTEPRVHAVVSSMTGQISGAREITPHLTASRLVVDARAGRLGPEKPLLESLDLRVIASGVRAPKAEVLASLLPPGDIRLLGGTLAADGDVFVASHEGAAGGTMQVALSRATLAVGKRQLSGDAVLSLRIAGLEREGVLDVSGTQIALKNVSVSDTSFRTKQWSGDAYVADGTFAFAPTPRFDGRLDLDARDASPFLAIAAGGIPAPISDLFDMDRLLGRVNLVVGDGEVSARNVEARGGDVAITGSFASAEGHQRGAFVVAKGPVSLGVRLDDEGQHLRFFNLGVWRAAQEKTIDAFEAGAEARKGKKAPASATK